MYFCNFESKLGLFKCHDYTSDEAAIKMTKNYNKVCSKFQKKTRLLRFVGDRLVEIWNKNQQ